MMELFLEPLQLAFFVRALVASIMVGVVCAVVGTYVVLRGIAFMGDAISHAAFPGLVAAYLLQVPFYLGAGVAAVATALGDADIPCNMVAGFHHDHLFVPVKDAARALQVLRELAASS